MAGYREHISVSGMLGIVYGVGAHYLLEFTPVQCALAGCLTWMAGMLPDLDSDTGRPVREMFGLAAAMAPLVLMQNLQAWAGNPEAALLMAVGLYAAIRHGGALVLGKLSVHRGMFHSIPALLIAAELVFLAYKSDQLNVKLLMAVGVGLGFLSHLLLDEFYSVEWTGIRIRLNKSAGSAFKLIGKNHFANVFTYSLLVALTYFALLSADVLQEPDWHTIPDPLRQAVEQLPNLK